MTLPRIVLLVLSDGRLDQLDQTLASWAARARHYDLRSQIIVDDSHHLLGFCGAIRYGWDRLREVEDAFEFVFHLEEDWHFNRAFSIAHMARLLNTEPQVQQVALRRGAEPGEVPVVDKWAEEFADRTTGILGLGAPARSQEWLEHRLFFTTNPCLYRRELLQEEWPPAPRCEAAFSDALIQAGGTFAYWGDRHDEPWITHTGHRRTGHGY